MNEAPTGYVIRRGQLCQWWRSGQGWVTSRALATRYPRDVFRDERYVIDPRTNARWEPVYTAEDDTA